MALQDILQKIIDEANADAARIQEELKIEQKKLEEQAKAEEAQELGRLKENAQVAMASVERKTDAMVRRESQKLLLQAKHTVISEALEKLWKHLCDLSDDKYTELLKVLLSKVSAPSGTILAPKNRLDLTKKVAPNGFDVKEDANIKGGIIIRTEKSEIDNSFRTIVFSEFRVELEMVLAQKLGFVQS